MHFLSTTLLLLGLSASNVLGANYGWIAIYNNKNCDAGYYLPKGTSINKVRPKFGYSKKPIMNWSPAALYPNNPITHFGVNWGTGGEAYQHNKVFFYSNKDCTSGWLGTLERPKNKKYDSQGAMTCFKLDGEDKNKVKQDGRAVQCIKSERADDSPAEEGAGIVSITNDCPTGC
ncbi:MAG: hypothetical protein Q9164_003513 [Protoblastenia rupestris]